MRDIVALRGTQLSLRSDRCAGCFAPRPLFAGRGDPAEHIQACFPRLKPWATRRLPIACPRATAPSSSPAWSVDWLEVADEPIPAFVSPTGELTAFSVEEDTEIVTLSAYANEDGTVQIAEKTVTIAAVDPENSTSALSRLDFRIASEGWPMALAVGDTIQRTNRVPHL